MSVQCIIEQCTAFHRLVIVLADSSQAAADQVQPLGAPITERCRNCLKVVNDDVLATNLRFSWLQSANAGFFVVYNEVDEGGFGALPKGRELIVKYSRIFDLL